MYILVNAAGRIGASSDTSSHGPDTIEIEKPENFVHERHADWKMVNGKLVYDPLPDVTAPENPIAKLESEKNLLLAQVQALEARGEFIEDCIAEMAMQVYGV